MIKIISASTKYPYLTEYCYGNKSQTLKNGKLRPKIQFNPV